MVRFLRALPIWHSWSIKINHDDRTRRPQENQIMLDKIGTGTLRFLPAFSIFLETLLLLLRRLPRLAQRQSPYFHMCTRCCVIVEGDASNGVYMASDKMHTSVTSTIVLFNMLYVYICTFYTYSLMFVFGHIEVIMQVVLQSCTYSSSPVKSMTYTMREIAGFGHVRGRRGDGQCATQRGGVIAAGCGGGCGAREPRRRCHQGPWRERETHDFLYSCIVMMYGLFELTYLRANVLHHLGENSCETGKR